MHTHTHWVVAERSATIVAPLTLRHDIPIDQNGDPFVVKHQCGHAIGAHKENVKPNFTSF